MSQRKDKKSARPDGLSKKRTSASSVKSRRREIERPLFQYKLGQREGKKETGRRMVTFTKKLAPSSSSLERPLIRMPVSRPRSRRAPREDERQLRLEPLVFEVPRPIAPLAPERAVAARQISREVLFSRLLAGMVDLLLPALMGFLFAFSASSVLNFDLLTVTSLRFGLVFFLSFYFLNSLFFLFTTRQTPGMYLTDLQLTGERSEDIPFGSICLRIGLFLPVAITLVGLAWFFFDPSCRCLHDRLSRTRVVPVQTSGRSPVAKWELPTR